MTDKLAKLRAWMQAQGVQAYIVPHDDAYQNEYTPASEERLAWLTGFTGSHGQAVILVDKACVMVGPIYHVQAALQVDKAAYDVVHAEKVSLSDYLLTHLKDGAQVGYDPMLMAHKTRLDLAAKVAEQSITLKAIAQNPIDALWTDGRPPAPCTMVEIYPESFAGLSSAEKRVQIGQKLQESKLDAYLLARVDSVAWLLNVRGQDVAHTPLPLSRAIVHQDGRVDWFVDGRKVDEAVRQHIGPQVVVHDPAALSERLRALQAAGLRLGAEPEKLAASFYDIFPDFVDMIDPCQLPKAIKNEVELEGIRTAHERDGVAMVRFLSWLDSEIASGRAVDELMVMEKLKGLRAEGKHFRDLSFETIAGSGPHGAIVHYRADVASNRVLQKGEFLLLDSGAQYLDGTTDITRTLVVGDTVSDEMKDRYTRVLIGHIALAMAVVPKGTRGAQLDSFARASLWGAGLDYGHGTGHGVGCYLGVHEGPQRIAPSAMSAVVPGMLTSNEPGYYKEGAYGIRIESLIVSHAHDTLDGFMCFETVTLCPIDLKPVVKSMLSASEIAWLNAYHQRVRNQLMPHLSEPREQAWLEKATQPL